MTLGVKFLKAPLVAILIISSILLQVLIAGVPIVTASPESPSKGNADTPQILPVGPPYWSAHPPIHIRRAATASPTGLSPVQIKTVYNLPSTGGSGTIAIIDAYDDPTVENDLNVFSSQFGLPQCNTTNPCFEKHMMAPTIRTDSGWALEISLDTQWAHAIAPNAKILLVEAKSNMLGDLLAAVDYARSRSDVVAISMSWGGGEFSGESSYDSYFTSSYGAIFFASSGDSGTGVQWPAVSSNVVGVGGTTLTLNPDGSLALETAWSGSGGGRSAYEPEPSYQILYNVPSADGKRAVPDVSYDADPNSGVSVYDSTPYFGQIGWFQVGGTSAGAPQWAAIQSLGFSASNNNLYRDAKSTNYPLYFRDITSGTNGNCGFYCTATTGYDYVTGLGSPLTTNYNAAPTPDFSISASPSALTIQAGSPGISTINVTSLNGFNGIVSLTASASTGLKAILSPSTLTIASGGFNSSTLSITASSTIGAGTYTVNVAGTNGSLTHSTTVTVTVQTVPSAPQSPTATAGNAQVTLSWSAPALDGGSTITNYTVYRGTLPGGETFLAQIGGNVLTYTDASVVNGVTYYYNVTANNSIGESAPSNEVSAMPSASVPTLHVKSIMTWTQTIGTSGNRKIDTQVTVVDASSGSGVGGATVFLNVNITSSGTTTTLTGSGVTDNYGNVTIIVGPTKLKGTYKSCVDNVVLANSWTFDGIKPCASGTL